MMEHIIVDLVIMNLNTYSFSLAMERNLDQDPSAWDAGKPGCGGGAIYLRKPYSILDTVAETFRF
jgi:hypothetical protein